MVTVTADCALCAILLSKPRASCPAYFLSSVVSDLGRRNRIMCACPLATERNMDKPALDLWDNPVLPSAGRQSRGIGANTAGIMG